MLIKDRNGYHIEDSMGRAERNQMGDVIYYESIPLHAFLEPVVDKTSNNPFKNPLSFDPFSKPNY